MWRGKPMPFCSHCGNQVRDADAYCTRCGARQPV
ncbi:MAG: zinc ribbon domain-containing protein, partial [Bryobacterales bacterium]|nr:zinc ribbon domain-containing protein [Bryobacterales bacterium]